VERKTTGARELGMRTMATERGDCVREIRILPVITVVVAGKVEKGMK